MENKIISKGLVIGIIVLFLGTNIVPAAINTKNIIMNNKNYTTEISDDTVYNLIGGVNISFNFIFMKPIIIIEWWRVEDRNFTYPVEDGMVKINYTIRLQTKSNGFFTLPRFAGLQSFLYYDGDVALGGKGTWKKVKWTQFQPVIEDLYVESYLIPVPEDGYKFLTCNVAYGIRSIPIHWNIISNGIGFWTYFS